MPKEKDDEKNRKKLDKHNQDKLREVLGRIVRGQKSQMKEWALRAQSGSSSLSRGDITVSYAMRRPGGFGRAGLGVIVMDPGNDRDHIMVGDFDQTDTIAMGDKDPTDNTHTYDKDGRDWGF